MGGGKGLRKDKGSSAEGWGAQGGVRLQFERKEIPVASGEVRKVTELMAGESVWAENGLGWG